ncbi:MAG: Lrp/AsnC ligand binding domain-containing protein [Bacteroidales bacterium]|nr:Lrp/AsnC ligand binding domain-containing protein [Bacteroidales bacterium]MCF8389034.1 Lrp/AsnC ligand binding domain-containing protein [Bacteroidales bacterium]
MDQRFKLDSLDKRILVLLSGDARMPYLEIARKCKVSGAAIHQRIQKMHEAGVINGSKFNINPKGLGYHTCAYIGLQVNLGHEITHEEVFEKIKKIPEIVECHHITGKYSLLVKIFAFSNEHLKKIIVGKIQAINEISSTETFLSLEEGFSRHLPIE